MSSSKLCWICCTKKLSLCIPSSLPAKSHHQYQYAWLQPCFQWFHSRCQLVIFNVWDSNLRTWSAKLYMNARYGMSYSICDFTCKKFSWILIFYVLSFKSLFPHMTFHIKIFVEDFPILFFCTVHQSHPTQYKCNMSLIKNLSVLQCSSCLQSCQIYSTTVLLVLHIKLKVLFLP